jgi:hypothetical protein
MTMTNRSPGDGRVPSATALLLSGIFGALVPAAPPPPDRATIAIVGCGAAAPHVADASDRDASRSRDPA